MAPETQEQQVERALNQLGVTSRLKGAPTYYFYEMSKFKRDLYLSLDKVLITFGRREMEGEKLTPEEELAYKKVREIFFNPEVNPYTVTLHNEDSKNNESTPLRVDYKYNKDELVLNNPEQTTKQILDHFHPIEWEEMRSESDWELMREVIPAMQVASPRSKIYEEQRWLYDERSQRAAETLSYRIYRIYSDKKLPEKMPLDDVQHRMMEEYESKLRKGGNPRRWFQEMRLKLSKTQ